jgi:hypothetical protein
MLLCCTPLGCCVSRRPCVCRGTFGGSYIARRGGRQCWALRPLDRSQNQNTLPQNKTTTDPSLPSHFPRRSLYVRGLILGYRRARTNTYPNTSLIKLENVSAKAGAYTRPVFILT